MKLHCEVAAQGRAADTMFDSLLTALYGPDTRLPGNGTWKLNSETEGKVLMSDKNFKATVSELANALQVVTVLSTKLRRDLHDSVQQSVDMEAAADRAVRAVRQLKKGA